MNALKKAFGWLLIAVVFGLGLTMVAFPAAITQVAGLAVAQTSTQWNQLKDMAVGDAQSSGVGLFSPCLYNGATCDRARGTIANGQAVDVTRLPGGAQTPADAFANPSTFSGTWSLLGLFNGTTWDRWDSVSNTNNTATTTQGAAYIVPLSTWSRTNTPAVATQATANIAAGGGTVRHVATSVTVCLAAGATAQTPLLFHLRDGATGAGTVLRSWVISAVISSSECENISGLNVTGSANTAMTIESAAAGAAATQATVSMTGYSTP